MAGSGSVREPEVTTPPHAKDVRREGRQASAIRVALGLVLPLGGPPSVDRHAAGMSARWLVPIGVVIGVGYACVYRVTWRSFGEVQSIRLVPAMAVWVLDVALCGWVLLSAAARAADRLHGARAPEGHSTVPETLGLVGVAAFVVLCVMKLVLWVSIPEGVSTWPGVWGRWFNFAYPHAFYRPLILAPIWGRWGVLLGASLGRPAPDADPLVKGLTSRQSTYRLLAWFVPIAALTAVYCGYNGRWMMGCVVALGVLAATYLFSVAAARRLGGQTRDTILAAGLVAETVYLVLYMGLSVRIYAG